MSNDKILITGGSGFIGTNLVEYYLKKGNAVLNLDKHRARNPLHDCYWKQCNILDMDHFKDICFEFNPDYFFHLAARTDLDGKTIDDYRENTDGVENTLDILYELKKLKRVMFFSSRLVCEIGYQPKGPDDYRPTTRYGESKVVGETLVKSANITKFPWDIVRPTSIWGPWFDVPYKNFFSTIMKRRYFHPRGRIISKSFGYVGNTIHQIDRLMFRPNSDHGETFYLADYPPLVLKEFADEISRQLHGRPVFELPTALLRMIAYAGDVLKHIGYGSPPLTSFRLNNLLTDMVYDLCRFQEIVGPLPYREEDGIRETLEWMKDIDS